MLEKAIPLPGTAEFVEGVETLAQRVEAGDVAIVSRMLTAQEVTLDAIFAEFTRRICPQLGKPPRRGGTLGAACPQGPSQ